VIGRTISHYKILSQLGSGGMGVVYEAEDTRLGRHVALKLLPAEACCDPQAMERFLREARIVSSLSHPHICTLHDIGDHEGQQFMIMELLEGESLKQRIGRGPLRLDDVLDLGTQIADALDAAHSHGVIHRDIKPANLFITRRGLAKVLDFGVAKLAESQSSERPDLERTYATSELTTVGSAIGTVAYMSPEQARGQDLDARSDLFSFGEVLYEMATGTPAFAGATPAVIFEGILTKQPPAPSQLNGNVPPEFDRIVAKALEKDRETRYQSAAELRADLKRLKRETESGRIASGVLAAPVASGATGVTPAPSSRRRLRLPRAVWIGAPVVALAVVAGVLLWQSERTPALTERDSVVLADFRNRTGDAMFDDTLNEALAVQLRQSPYLNLLPEQQVQATLRLMGRQPMEPLTPEIAGEVCQRNGAKAMLSGTIGNIGNRYLLTLSAEDCVSGAILAEEQVDAEGKDDVINALGEGVSAFREKLGESLASVQRYDQNIEMATTTSLEALKAYSQGMTTRRTQGDFESVPFFRRAVQLDPDFALAYARLGTVLSNLNERTEAEKATRRSYELRDKVSDRERWYIEARFYSIVERNVDKAIEAYRLLLATYPDDYAAHSNLGSQYRNLGRNREALQHLEQAVRLAPMQPLGHLNLSGLYVDEGRWDDGRRELEEVLKLQESMSARTTLVIIGTVTGDAALVERQIAAAKGQRAEVDMFAIRAQAAQYLGQMKEAARLTDITFGMLRDLNRVENLSEGLLGLAIGQALTGRHDQARLEADRIFKAGVVTDAAADEAVALGALLSDRPLIDAYLTRALAQLKDITQPDDLAKAERAVRALEALGKGDYRKAYDLGVSNGMDYTQRSSLFVAVLSALRMERWDDAARVGQALVGFGPRIGFSPNAAVARILLARALAGAGRQAEARAAYDEAFRIWKDADPDLPLMVEAKQEYQRLTS
jgi:tetratricopeptide (TPR) repeat protein